MSEEIEPKYHSGQVGMDYRNELDKIEIQRLTSMLKLAEEVIEFYADPEHWITRREDFWDNTDPKWHGDCELIRKYSHPDTCGWIGSIRVGGKRAREYFKNKESKDE